MNGSNKTVSHAKMCEEVANDVLWMLIAIYSVRKVLEFPDLSTMSRTRFAAELIVLESAQRDLVMRLTAPDDDKNRSFQQLKKLTVKVGASQDRQKKVFDAVREYRGIINRLKTQHRNRYIAHVAPGIDQAPKLMEKLEDITKAAKAAVHTLDVLSERHREYRLSAGAYEQYDLRAELGV